MNFPAKRLMGAVAVGAMSATLLTAAPQAARADTITGAGATFPYPVYAKWAAAYKGVTGVEMNYQSIGSGGGIKQIEAKVVDFGATDAPLDGSDLDDHGLIQWPMVVGGIVPIVNIPGIAPGQLRLTGPLLAKIYLGEITNWNDSQITALNPGVNLPNLAIAPVFRSDGSGTTFNFTYFLGDVDQEWKDKVGVNKSVQFPTGIGGKGNEGVAAFTAQTSGAIGYVEYAYAVQSHLTYTKLYNKAGNFVAPSAANFAAAAANANWATADHFKIILANQPGANSWPMTAATFILVYAKQDKPDTGKQVLKFFDWDFKNGKDLAASLDYVPMPDNVVALVENTWHTQISGGGAPLWP